MRDTNEMVRREVMQAMVDAAKADGVSIHADAVALASHQDLVVIGAPIAGLEKIEFKHLLEGASVLDDTPVMYWYFAGEALGDKAFPFSEGFYTLVANQRRGIVALKSAKGKTVAQGDLKISIEPPAPKTARIKISVSGGITKFDINMKKKHIEVCGNASAEVGSASVKVEGCISVDF